MNFQRYAIYFTPPPGRLAEFGAAWLGWDMATGAVPPPPDIPELAKLRETITQTPRKYGFHATLKPPFRLAEGQTSAALEAAVATLGKSLAPAQVEGLQLARLGRFLALVPDGDTTRLNALAARIVRDLDSFRAPPTEAEIEKRRASGLNPEQDALLMRWGYPYVMSAYRFHMTLTGKMPKAQAEEVQKILKGYVPQLLTQPFIIDAISLVGEDDTGFFRIIHRQNLSG